MIGAIIGDIVGSRFEILGYKTKEFNMFEIGCNYTDDTTMTLAIGEALTRARDDFSDLGARSVEWGICTQMPATAAVSAIGCARKIPSPTTAMAMVRPCV